VLIDKVASRAFISARAFVFNFRNIILVAVLATHIAITTIIATALVTELHTIRMLSMSL
jgi:hypothetical protein